MTISESFWKQLSAHLSASPQQGQAKIRVQAISGGDINRAFRLTTSAGEYFVKINTCDKLSCFNAEKKSLEKLAAYCPKVIAVGHFEQHAFLALHYVELSTRGDERRLGSLIADLHSIRGSSYGWQEDNYLGLNLQVNTPCRNWAEFWISRRVKPQIELAYRNGFAKLEALEEPLVDAINRLLDKHQPEPSLLHGDLWSGNKGFSRNGKPIIFDPASYFGDAETDIAMTELFGGFGSGFYQAYYQSLPKKPGYQTRKVIYNLYHILNHLNLFGDTYLGESLRYANTIIAASKKTND